MTVYAFELAISLDTGLLELIKVTPIYRIYIIGHPKNSFVIIVAPYRVLMAQYISVVPPKCCHGGPCRSRERQISGRGILRLPALGFRV